MKRCTKCEESLPLDAFYGQVKKGNVNGQKWHYKDSMCKKCRSEYTSERRREVKRLAVAFLGGKCLDCNLVDDPVVYDFHHLDPTQKDFSLGKQNLTFERVKNELKKCVLLCSNCHRKRHATKEQSTEKKLN